MFNYTSVCKTEVVTEFLENLIPEGAKKFAKKTEEVPEASEKRPRKPPRPKMRPTKARVGLQRATTTTAREPQGGNMVPKGLQQQRLGSHREAIWCPGGYNNNGQGLHFEPKGPHRRNKLR